MSKVLLKSNYFRERLAVKNRLSTAERVIRTIGPGEGETIIGFPSSGTTGQSLVKINNENYKAEWKTITGGGAGEGEKPIKVSGGKISLEELGIIAKYLATHSVTEEKLSEALLGPVASHY